MVKVPGKSTLQDYAHWLEAGAMQTVLDALTILGRCGGCGGCGGELGSSGWPMHWNWTWCGRTKTCLKAAIHFPIDWVLLRDATRTLMKAVILIRNHGLMH